MNEDIILSLFKNRLHQDTALLADTSSKMIGFAQNSHCGDEIWFHISKVNGHLKISFNGHACSMTLASAEYLAQLSETSAMGDSDCVEELGKKVLTHFGMESSHQRSACVLLPVNALHSAIKAVAEAPAGVEKTQ